jgi:hypothetical protein
MEKTYIEEIQSFGWLGIAPGIIAVMFGIFCFFQIVLKRQIGNHPAPNWLLILIFVLTATLAMVFSLQRLRTSITDQAIYVSFGIFASKKVIPLSNIKSISVRKYDGMKEFSGWGVKANANEQSYTVSGDNGVEIELNSEGKKILIGTDKPNEMLSVIDKYLGAISKKAPKSTP